MNTQFRALLDELKKIGLPSDDFVVFGSGPIVIRDLRDPADIDIVARGEAWEMAKRLGEHGTSEFGDDSYRFADGKIEIADRWGDWDIDRLIDTADDFDDIRFVSLEIVQQEKMRRGREKDLKDVELIGRYMAGIEGQQESVENQNSALSEYHQKYAALPDEEIAKRVAYKMEDLKAVMKATATIIGHAPLLIAVLGCPDPRYRPLQQQMLEKTLGKSVKLTTYDITVDHLQGVPGAVQHDVTEPLPGGPYDFILAHVLLRFIEEDRQWYVIFNSYDALKPGGVAIHVLDEEDYTTGGAIIPDGYHPVPLEKWKDKMRDLGMDYVEVPIEHGVALAIMRK